MLLNGFCGAVLFDGVIGDAGGKGFVCFDGCCWTGMSHFFEWGAQWGDVFASIVKECTELSFSGRGYNCVHDGAVDMDSTIEGWLVQLQDQVQSFFKHADIEGAPCMGMGFGLWKIDRREPLLWMWRIMAVYQMVALGWGLHSNWGVEWWLVHALRAWAEESAPMVMRMVKPMVRSVV
jgi:hypothetical protein